MDYLKSKVVRAKSPSSSEDEEEAESEDEAVNCDEGSETEDGDSCAAPARQDGERTGPSPEPRPPSGNKKSQEARAEVCLDWGVRGCLGRWPPHLPPGSPLCLETGQLVMSSGSPFPHLPGVSGHQPSPGPALFFRAPSFFISLFSLSPSPSLLLFSALLIATPCPLLLKMCIPARSSSMVRSESYGSRSSSDREEPWDLGRHTPLWASDPHLG